MIPVLHVITTIERGGAEKQLVTLVRAQIASGRKVSVVFLKGQPELKVDLLNAGIFKIYDFSKFGVLKQIFELFRINLKESNLVHAHLPRAELFAAISKARNKLIVSRHNSERFFPKAPPMLSILLSRLVVSNSSGVIAISIAVRDFLIDSKEVKKSDEVQLVYYGFEPSVRSNFPSISGVEEIVVGTVSRLTSQKDIPTLLRAFQGYSENRDNVFLEIIGDGELKIELMQLASELKLNHKVRWIGRVNSPEKYIASWKCFLLSSKYEGFGLVLLEAMQQNVPIIACNNSAIPEVLGNDYIGLVKTGDHNSFSEKLTSFENKNLHELAIKQLAKRLRNFQPGLMLEKMDRIYESVQ
jgi:glycosyltransferase involved in cell wall biosynthesis